MKLGHLNHALKIRPIVQISFDFSSPIGTLDLLEQLLFLVQSSKVKIVGRNHEFM